MLLATSDNKNRKIETVKDTSKYIIPVICMRVLRIVTCYIFYLRITSMYFKEPESNGFYSASAKHYSHAQSVA